MRNPYRYQVLEVYRQVSLVAGDCGGVMLSVGGRWKLLFLGREYPLGYRYFRDRCKAAFWKQRELVDVEQVQRGLDRARYVVKELEALYFLQVRRAEGERTRGASDPCTD